MSGAGSVKIGRLFAEPGGAPCRRGAAVAWHDGRIVEVSSTGAVDDAGAGSGLVALPALVNAHDHGRGLHHLAFGARDQMLELWRVALYAHPPIDPYLSAALAFGRLVRAGVGSVVHVHSSIIVDRLAADAEAVARAAKDVGIRLAFVVPLRDCRTIAYGDDDDLVARHDPRDQTAIRDTWLYDFPKPPEYMALVRDIAARIESRTVTVQLGPNSPIACTDALLEATADESARSNRRIHTHLLETSTQEKWADATYARGLVRHLDELGVLSRRFTGAHGVWLKPAECELLAERGCSIAVNTSSNLRLRSGIASVSNFLKAGLGFGFGIDSFSVDDDDDAFRELRLTHWLHSLTQSPAPLTPDRLFHAALDVGYTAVTNRGDYGRVEVGAPADLVVLDYDAMGYDVIADMADEMDVLLTRATTRYVRDVYVDGRQVVAEGRVLGIDLAAVEKEVLAQARAAGAHMRSLRPVMERSQATLDTYYRSAAYLGRLS
jgi:cytosine/adenosine deaminase-related metal-dependent hydrolase